MRITRAEMLAALAGWGSRACVPRLGGSAPCARHSRAVPLPAQRGGLRQGPGSASQKGRSGTAVGAQEKPITFALVPTTAETNRPSKGPVIGGMPSNHDWRSHEGNLDRFDLTVRT